MSRRWPYIGPSEAQTLAESRSSTYADANAASWVLRMDRKAREPQTLREYVHELRKAYADEVPGRLHSRDTDAGGVPEWTPAFAHYIDGRPSATNPDETYVTPFRAAITFMERGDVAQQMRATVIRWVVVGGMDPTEAAKQWAPFERVVALHACRAFWRAMSDIRIVSPRRAA